MFKKLALALILCLAFASYSFAAADKIGIYNAQRVSQESDAGKEAQKKFESQFGAENVQLEKQAQDLQKKFTDYQAQESALAQKAKEDKQLELMRERRDLDEKMSNFAGRVEQVQNTLLQEMGGVLVQACTNIAKKSNYAVIIDGNVSGVVYVDPASDITNAVIAEMNSLWKTRAKK